MPYSIIPSGPLETNTILLWDEEEKECAIIDPAMGSFEVIKQSVIEHRLQVTKILLTHSHADHIADLAKCKEFFKVPLYVHPLDKPNVEEPGKDGLPLFLGKIQPCKCDHLLEEGQRLNIGRLEIDVITTPGHTPGGVCFYLPKEKLLLSGDTLFKHSCGSLSFPTAEPEKMWQSLKKLATLPRDTLILPGHGPSTTIGEESWLQDPQKYFNLE